MDETTPEPIGEDPEPLDSVEVAEPAESSAEAARPFGTWSNRRGRATGALKTCRLCWKPITIEAKYVEEDPPRVYFRCPHCLNSFPIRHSDIPKTVEATVQEAPSPEAPSREAELPAAVSSWGGVWAALEEHAVDKLDLPAVRALLRQVERWESQNEPTAETGAIRRSLEARENLLVALDDLEHAIAAEAVRRPG